MMSFDFFCLEMISNRSIYIYYPVCLFCFLKINISRYIYFIFGKSLFIRKLLSF